MKVAIIGAGAAGFFTAINLKRFSPKLEVTIYESSPKVLSKVAVSGGGRCNLTNSFEGFRAPLSKVYPRGAKLVKAAFRKLNHTQTYDWFETEGIKLVTQPDNCVFPASQDSGEIIEMFIRRTRELDITVKTQHKVKLIEKTDNHYTISFDKGVSSIKSDIVVVTVGGKPQMSGFEMLRCLPVEIIEPMPSLFSLNIDHNPITELSGAVVEKAIVGLQGTKLRTQGALLITHWGVSGPTVLKLSSYAARTLCESDYKCTILINWVGSTDEDKIIEDIKAISSNNSKKFVTSTPPYDLSSRVWAHILYKAEIPHERRWAEIGSKGFNRIIATLIGDHYAVSGKSTHKEEFVTAGGVDISSLDFDTLEAKKSENLYFAGEVIDIDAITGGFNLQAAWSTGFAVAKAISEKTNN
ncbi:MAG: NAD(P)/FAD-dependent oxidoreductase [Rikenellaceae bacterium]